ncbi:MAG: DNA mismatch repair endonuclease MutL [candidate division NC10 bacterium]
MGIIRILDDLVANKIAAGEVVERPAAVVKELVENSLDARAETIEVRVLKGGKTFIQVTDDGCGMSREDAELCLERHATSKIARAEDILSLTTLGFRGEALPSIATVSQFTLITREPTKSEGVKITVEGGKNRTGGVGAAPPGTTVAVKNLFFNSPARRKFLHADATEFGHIHSTLVATALAHPQVRFRLLHNDQVIFDLLPAPSTMERIAALHPVEFCRGLVGVEHSSQHLTVTGYVGAPALAKANRSGQLFFVNSRPIKNTALNLTLRQAYQGLLPQGRFPVAVLFLEIPPSALDVNVHPTKREVRFHRERDLLLQLTDIISQTLRRADIFKELALSTTQAFPLEAPHHAGGPLVREAPQKYSPTSAVRPRMESSPPWSSDGREETPSRGTPTFVPPAPFRLLGQFRGTYLIVEVEGGLWIVDQHAAHERVMFEKVLASFEAGSPEVQFFLTPPILELLPHERAILEEYREALEAIGFSLAPFGGNSYQVQSMPAYFHSGEVTPLLREFIDRKQDHDLGSLVEDRRAEIAARVACKMKSIKAGETLAPEAMEALVHSLLACSSPFTCPHGRPTMIRLTATELDRQFDRR